MIECKLIKSTARFNGSVMWDVEIDDTAVGSVHLAGRGSTVWMNSNEDRTYYTSQHMAVAFLLASLIEITRE